MKTLREYKIKLDQSDMAPASRGVAWGASFTPALHGEVNGIPVRILNIGDLPGASPVYNCVDKNGFSIAVRQADVLFTDGAALPLSSSDKR
jgi:hypothetical protein